MTRTILRKHALARREAGAALVVALIALALIAALGFSLAIVIDTETRVVGNYSGSRESLYAADGALEIALQELLEIGDLNLLLAGGTLSGFTDGAPAGTRQLTDGRVINLAGVTAQANAEPRPWGANNPQWQLFAYGRLGPAYVMAWAGDDPAENDGNPAMDGEAETNPGAGVVMLRAEAFASAGAHKVLEAIVRHSIAPTGEPVVQMLSWHEIR
jgi:hypothetical protein